MTHNKIHFSQKQIEDIINMYFDRKSSTDIANKYNCNYKVILKLLKKHNIKVKNKNIIFSLEQELDICRLYQTNSIKSIASQYKVNASKIRYCLKKHKISIKPSHLYTAFKDENKKLIINEFYKNKKCYKQIVTENNCSASYVKAQLKKYAVENNIPCRDCGSYNNLIINDKRYLICLGCRLISSNLKKKNYNKKRTIKRSSNPTQKIAHNIGNKIRQTLKSKNINKLSATFNVLSYSSEKLRNHLESQFEWWMNWSNYGKYNSKTWDDNNVSSWTWQIDHIIPASTFTYTSTEDDQFKQCWALQNLRPLSSKINYLDGVRRTRHK